MALQLGNLRDALKEAGASDESARLAAEEVAAYESKLASIEQRLANLDRQFAELRAQFVELRSYVDLQLAAVRSDIRLLRWMTGTLGGVIVAFQVAIFLKLFVHG